MVPIIAVATSYVCEGVVGERPKVKLHIVVTGLYV